MSKRKRPISKAEAKFLAEYDASMFPHPSVAVDVALVAVDEAKLKVLVLKRNEHPDFGLWSMPGGFVQMKESLDDAANRLLSAKAGVSGIFLEQLYTFGRPDRDPRTRVIAVAYYALVTVAQLKEVHVAGNGVRLVELRVDWKGERGGDAKIFDDDGKEMPLAFDHEEILGAVVKRLRGKLNYAPIGFELLPKKFTLRQLQTIHETILGHRVNKDSFRRRMLATGMVSATGELETDVSHRPAELYRFKRSGKGRSR